MKAHAVDSDLGVAGFHKNLEICFSRCVVDGHVDDHGATSSIVDIEALGINAKERGNLLADAGLEGCKRGGVWNQGVAVAVESKRDIDAWLTRGVRGRLGEDDGERDDRGSDHSNEQYDGQSLLCGTARLLLGPLLWAAQTCDKVRVGRRMVARGNVQLCDGDDARWMPNQLGFLGKGGLGWAEGAG